MPNTWRRQTDPISRENIGAVLIMFKDIQNGSERLVG